MTPIEILKENIEECRLSLIEAYKGILPIESLQKGNPWFDKQLTSLTIKLLEGEIERLKNKKIRIKDLHTPNCVRGTCKNDHLFCAFTEETEGYNQAIDESIDFIESQLSEIKKI